MKFNFMLYIIFHLLFNLRCQDLILFDVGHIKFSFLDDLHFQVEVKGIQNHWIGFSYGGGMQDVDMNLIEFIRNETYTLQDTFSTGYTFPYVDESKGGRNDLEVVSFDVDEFPILKYKRKFNTEDKHDAVVHPDTEITISVAWGSGKLSYHGMNYLTDTICIQKEGCKSSSRIDFWSFHGTVLTFMWTVLSFIGYISARFLKHLPIWRVLHFIGCIMPSFITLILLLVSLYLSNIKDIPNNNSSAQLHIKYGIVITSFVALQIVTGILKYFFVVKNLKTKWDLTYLLINLLHKLVGICLTFTVYINISTGFVIGKWNHLVTFPALLCSLFISILIIIEFHTFITNRFKKVQYIHECIKDKNEEAKEYYTLKILHPKDLNKEMKNKQFVVYENFICDVEDFIFYHPGGSLLIESNLYSDIGRFLTGTQDYSKKVKSYSHKYLTHKNLVESLAYAKIYDNHQLVLRNESFWSPDFGLSVYLQEDSMILNSKRIIADNIFEYKFNVGKYTFSDLLPGISWIGRHFSISSTNLNKTRYYSLCLNLDEAIQKKHHLLYNNLKSLENGASTIDCNISEKKLSTRSNLNLYIKNYNNEDCLSRHISNLIEKEENDLIIRGPNGAGLNLFEQLEGTYVIFAAGTGVLPFIDLIAFTFRYAIYKISKDIFNVPNNVLIKDENIIFDKIVKSNFRLKVFFSFKSFNSALYLDICEKLQELERQYNLELFDFYLRISSENHEHYSRTFLKRKLEHAKNKITKVMVVGPVSFMDDIKFNLLNSEIASLDKIILI